MVVLLRVLVVDMLVLLVREDVLLEVLVVVVSQVAGTCHETETRLEKRRNAWIPCENAHEVRLFAAEDDPRTSFQAFCRACLSGAGMRCSYVARWLSSRSPGPKIGPPPRLRSRSALSRPHQELQDCA